MVEVMVGYLSKYEGDVQRGSISVPLPALRRGHCYADDAPSSLSSRGAHYDDDESRTSRATCGCWTLIYVIGAAGCRTGGFEGHEGAARGGLHVQHQVPGTPAGTEEVSCDERRAAVGLLTSEDLNPVDCR